MNILRLKREIQAETYLSIYLSRERERDRDRDRERIERETDRMYIYFETRREGERKG